MLFKIDQLDKNKDKNEQHSNIYKNKKNSSSVQYFQLIYAVISK